MEFDRSFQQFGRKMSDDQLLFLALPGGWCADRELGGGIISSKNANRGQVGACTSSQHLYLVMVAKSGALYQTHGILYLVDTLNISAQASNVQCIRGALIMGSFPN